jgi:phospholipid transport system transporter-binding protein
MPRHTVADGAGLTVDGDRALLEGVLDHRSVPALAAESDDLFAGRTALEIDLARVSSGNSAGLALLLEWLRRARRAECRLGFRNLPPSLRDIARVSGIEPLLPIRDADG